MMYKYFYDLYDECAPFEGVEIEVIIDIEHRKVTSASYALESDIAFVEGFGVEGTADWWLNRAKETVQVLCDENWNEIEEQSVELGSF